eukprot:954498_1
MLSRLVNRTRMPLYSHTMSLSSLGKRFNNPQHDRDASSMFCMQCEQTNGGTGCISQGICGKWPETAKMQDLLLYVNNGIGQYLANMDESTLDPTLKEKTRAHLLESTFSTLTNVNFSEDSMIEYMEKSLELREEIVPVFRKANPEKTDFEKVMNSPCNYTAEDIDDTVALHEDATNLASLYAYEDYIGDKNCFGLRECAQYGLKGMMAYFDHAESMNLKSGTKCYDDTERDFVYKICYQVMNDLTSNSKDLMFWLGVNMKIGETNVKVLELLDKAHTTCFGIPQPTEVTATPVEGKCILMSGHDVLDVYRVCEGIAKKGLNINVYTHGELLPAHAFPNIQEKYKNILKGHFGKAWQDQYVDFKKFPGPCVLTSNCLMQPRKSYKHRLFTTHAVGFDDIPHLDLETDGDLDILYESAQKCDGWDNAKIAKLGAQKPFLCGFNHSTILAQADVVIDAIKSGALTDVFVIGGCDGSEDS